MADGGQDFNLGHVVGSAGEKGDDGSTVWNTSTAPTYANSKYTFTISNLSGKTGLQIAVNDIIFYSTYYYIVSTVNTTTVDCSTRVSIKGSDASVTIQTSWGSTTSDSKVPSEKLTKDTLDTKIAKSSTTGLIKNDGTIMTSGTGSTNYSAGNHTHSSYVNGSKVTSWSSTVSDSNIPSEKLVKNSLDDKIGKSSTSGLVKNDGTIDTSSYLTTSSASSTYQPKLVSGTSIKTINNESLLGSGNISVGGSSVDIVTAWESTLSDSKVPSEKLTKETINALNVFDIGQNNSTNAVCLSKDIDSDGKGMAFANAILIYNENNDKLYYDKNTNGDTDSGNELATMNDIPSLANYVQKSSTSGLLKNDGSIDTSSYITSSAISGMLTSSDIADNLTTNDSTKVLSAKQGKVLNDLIGQAIAYINQ